MVPLEHGVPEPGLIPWLRLWPSVSGKTLTGNLFNGWKLLFKPVDNGIWLGYMGPEGKDKDLFTELYERSSGYLSGCYGSSRLVLLKNRRRGWSAYLSATEKCAKEYQVR